ncbi:type IV secretion system DNA-binding domain-containing protein [Desulfobacterota bacterium AH_259_B03_O07]|nr:type IV secretion system DNA-binding domain-containing protein [Desulfobacterota bacterium AH_259_B03_O07]
MAERDDHLIDIDTQRPLEEMTEEFFVLSSKGCLDAISPYPVILEPHSGPLQESPERYKRDIKRSIVLKMFLSPIDRVSPETSELFLNHLREIQEPISFEIIATRNQTTVQILLQETDRWIVEGALEAAYPNSYVQKSKDPFFLRSRYPLKEEKAAAASLQFDFNDYYLPPPFYFPLNTFSSSFARDFLDAVFALFSKLKQEELGFYQAIFIPAERQNWAKISRNLVGARRYDIVVKEAKGWAGFSEDSPRVYVRKPQGKAYHPWLDDGDLALHERRAKEKIQDGNPFFAVSVRAGFFAYKEKAPRMLSSLRSALGILTPGDRKFHYLTRKAYFDSHISKKLLYYSFLSRVSLRPGMLLTTKELTGLVHFPTKDILKKGYPIEEAKGRHFPPAVVTKEGSGRIALGEAYYRGKTIRVTLPHDERLRHTHLIGKSGWGKSTLIENLILEDIKQGTGICLIEPHGDLIDDLILPKIPPEHRDRVIYFDPVVSPIRINIFEVAPGENPSAIADDLLSIFQRINPTGASTSWGPQMEQVLSQGVLAILKHEEGGHIGTLHDFLLKEKFRNDYIKGVHDEHVREFWEHFKEGFRRDAPITAQRRIDPLVRREDLRRVLSHTKSSISFRRIMDEGKILLVKVSSMGAIEAYMIGSLIASKMISAAMSREDIPEEERKPFYLYIDECHHFLCKSLQEILTGMRKFGLGLVLSHQFVSQLFESDEILAKAIMQGPNIRVGYQMEGADAATIAKEFSHYTADDFKKLGRGKAIVKVGSSENDFELEAFWEKKRPKEEAEQVKQELIRQTQERYGTGVDTSVERESKDVMVTPERAALEEKDKEELLSTEDFSGKGFEYTEKDVPKDTKIEITPDQRKFLEFLANSEELLPVRHLYTEIGFGKGKGTKLKGELVTMELINEMNIHLGKAKRESKILSLTKKGYHALGLPPNPGKAGPLHRHLQRIVSERAEKKGYESVIEEGYENGRHVDVGLTKDGIKTAVEISVSTRPDHVAKTIGNALDGGYHKVIALFIESNVLDQTKELVTNSLSSEQISKVSFCLAGEIGALL